LEQENKIVRVSSIAEAKQLAEATGKPVHYELIVPNKQTFQPNLTFFDALRLRSWLLRKRLQWYLGKIFRRLRDEMDRKNQPEH